VYLSREKEDDEVLLNLVIKTTDKSRSNLNSDGIEINMNNEKFLVEVEIIDAMKDLKLKKKSGIGGLDFLLCKSKQAYLTSPTAYKDALKIYCNTADTRTIFLSIFDEADNIIINQHDFNNIYGVTRSALI